MGYGEINISYGFGYSCVYGLKVEIAFIGEAVQFIIRRRFDGPLEYVCLVRHELYITCIRQIFAGYLYLKTSIRRFAFIVTGN